MGEHVEKEQILLCGKQDFLFSIFTSFSPHTLLLRLCLLPFKFFSPKGAFSLDSTKSSSGARSGAQPQSTCQAFEAPIHKKEKKIQSAGELSVSHITACP